MGVIVALNWQQICNDPAGNCQRSGLILDRNKTV